MWVCQYCHGEFDFTSKWEALSHARDCRSDEWTCVECGETLPDDGSLEANGKIINHAWECYYE